MPRVLLAVTSANPLLYPSGKRTGVFWAEAAHPYDVFTQAGWTVDMASETGHAFVDEHSVSDEMLAYSDSADTWNDKSHPVHAILKSGLKLAKDLKASDYDAVYFTAGHGALYDYPTATNLGKIAVQLYEAGKPVAAVCHGPAIFKAAKTASGESIAKGKRITGFTRRGEVLMGVDKKMAEDGADDCETVANDIGAIWDEPADPWADYTTADGLILTGVNPKAGASLARNVLQAVKA